MFTVPQSAYTEVSDEVLWMMIALIGAEINAFKVRTIFSRIYEFCDLSFARN